jgi:hypothetical protein
VSIDPQISQITQIGALRLEVGGKRKTIKTAELPLAKLIESKTNHCESSAFSAFAFILQSFKLSNFLLNF